MQVIITGGSGFIGSRLCAFLAGNGHEVVVLSRNPEKSGPRLQGLARATYWDGKSEESWWRLIDSDTAIVNLAGDNIASARWSPVKKDRILNSRLMSGHAVAKAVDRAKEKPACLVQGSAVGYYGDTGPAKIDESAPAGTDFLAQVSTAWENSTLSVEKHGVRRVVIRTGLVLGNGGALAKMLPMFRLGLGGVVGSGRQVWPWIHIDDQVAAIAWLMGRADAQGPFNFTAPAPATNREFTKALARAVKRPAFFPVPAFMAKIALGEMAEATLLSGQRALPEKLLETGYRFTYTTLDHALKSIILSD